MNDRIAEVVCSAGQGRGAAERMRGMRSIAGTFTTEYPASSYGIPVLLIDGQPHGPADVAAKWPGSSVSLVGDVATGERAFLRERGWNVV